MTGAQGSLSRLVLALASALTALAGSMQSPGAQAPTGFAVHESPQAVPEIEFENGRGEAMRLADFRGKVNWMFLTSGPDRPEDTTRSLSERFGHKFTRSEGGYQIHGVVTHVIDREGRWQANFHGLEFEPTNLVLYINALTHPHAEERRSTPSWWDRIVNLF